MKLRYHLKILKLHWETSQQIKPSLTQRHLSLPPRHHIQVTRTTCDHWALRCWCFSTLLNGSTTLTKRAFDQREWQVQVWSLQIYGEIIWVLNHRLPKNFRPHTPGTPKRGWKTLLKIYDATVQDGWVHLPPSFKGRKFRKYLSCHNL